MELIEDLIKNSKKLSTLEAEVQEELFRLRNFHRPQDQLADKLEEIINKLNISVEESARAACQSAAAFGFCKASRAAERSAATEVSRLNQSDEF